MRFKLLVIAWMSCAVLSPISVGAAGEGDQKIEVLRKRAAEADHEREWLNLARAEQAAGNHSEAVKAAANYLARHYSRYALYMSTADRMGDLKRARELADASLEKLGDAGSELWRRDLLDAIARIRSIARDPAHVTSTSAVLMHELKMMPDSVTAWIARSLEEGSLDYPVELASNAALIQAARGQMTAARDLLEPLIEEATPYDESFWMILGQSRHLAGDMKGALKAYLEPVLLSGLGDSTAAVVALRQAYRSVNGNEDGLLDLVNSTRQTRETIDVPPYEATTSFGRVALLELFTGSECPPCLSADYACDALAEHFTRDQLAILVYHLHIPGPDPMTNDDTVARQAFYGVRSTPTVIVQGTEFLVGGGPKLMVSNRFHAYRKSIVKHLPDSPPVTISGSAVPGPDHIRITTTIYGEAGAQADLKLHRAIVERVVDYIGRNKVAHHTFVVRKLVGGPEGIAVDLSSGPQTVTSEIRPSAVQSELEAYLVRFAADPPARHKSRFTRWREDVPAMEPDNLAIVAWVQNSVTKVVMQARYFEVPPGQAAEPVGVR